MGNCLKSGSESWTGSLLLKEEMLLLWQTIPSSCWQPKSNQVVFPTTEYYFQDPTNESRFHPLIESKKTQECWQKIIQSVEKKKTLPKISDNLRSVQPNLIEEDFDVTTFADVDAEVIAVQPPPSDAETVAVLLETEGVSDDDYYYSHDVADEPVKCPDKNELLQVIENLQRFSLFLDKGDKIQSYASRIESQVDQHFAKMKK